MTFDEWRARYKTLTFAEHQEYYSKIFASYPNQKHFHDSAPQEFFAFYPARRVLEIGGWDGALAARILALNPQLELWTNLEICVEAAKSSIPTDPRYEAPPLTNWPWTSPRPTYDTLFMSHSIEHMQVSDIQALLSACPDLDYLYIDTPLSDQPPTWAGYEGTHILEVGWRGLIDLLEEWGFEFDTYFPNSTVGFFARARNDG